MERYERTLATSRAIVVVGLGSQKMIRHGFRNVVQKFHTINPYFLTSFIMRYKNMSLIIRYTDAYAE